MGGIREDDGIERCGVGDRKGGENGEEGEQNGSGDHDGDVLANRQPEDS